MELILAALLLLATVFAGLPLRAQDSSPAELVLKNANIYTVDERNPRARAVAVQQGKILFVGSNADVQRYVGPATRVLDLQGATVVPGLTDSHYHFIGVGRRELSFNLEGTSSLDDLLARLKQRVA